MALVSTDSSKIPADRIGVVIPQLIVSDGKGAIEHYKNAFGAEVLSVKSTPDGRVMHSELRVLGALLFVVDEFPEYNGGKHRSAKALQATPVVLNFAVPNVDAVYDKAVAAGSTGTRKPEDMFWGDRYASVTDPFGHDWAFTTPLKGDQESWPKMDFEPKDKKAKAE